MYNQYKRCTMNCSNWKDNETCTDCDNVTDRDLTFRYLQGLSSAVIIKLEKVKTNKHNNHNPKEEVTGLFRQIADEVTAELLSAHLANNPDTKLIIDSFLEKFKNNLLS